MKRRLRVTFCLVALAAILHGADSTALRLRPAPPGAVVQAAARAQSAKRRRPNIVLIFADNLGWGEVGVYGSVRGAPTPPNESGSPTSTSSFRARSRARRCSPGATPCGRAQYKRWPGRIPAGRVSNEIVHQIDFFPTLAAAVGADIVPKDRAIDGVNQLPF